MSWEDRLQTASYESKSGIIQSFDYEDVQESYVNKGSAFNFPNGTSTYIQRSGSTSYKFPMVCFFHGDNYDLEAAAFMSLLRTQGVGKLNHPIYGTINVVPLGEIQRDDKLKTEAGVATISVTFLETSIVVFPTVQQDPEALVMSQINRYNQLSAERFGEQLRFDSVQDSVNLQDRYENKLLATSTTLTPVVSTNTQLKNTFDTIYNSIALSLDDLFLDPQTLASQTMLLISSASYAPDAISNRLTAYGLLIAGVVATTPADSNELLADTLFAQTYIIGAVSSVVNTEFETQSDALGAASFLLDTFVLVNSWYDENLQALDVIDEGGTYEALQDAVAVTAGLLIEISFSLKQERLYTLTSPRSLVDLVFELYGQLDEQYDFFIKSNNLTGSEILELPAGKTVRYYI